MHYKLSYQDPRTHFLEIEFSFSNKGKERQLVQLPAWRPGRYELGNFAKNIQKFEIFSEGSPLSFKKINKDSWEIECKGAEEITVKYNYFAQELNAGSTYLDADQMYVNGVNCLVYLPDRQEEKCMLELELPDDYKVACGLEQLDQFSFSAKDFHELVDCPIIASASIQQHSFKVAEVNFHLWFQGECKPDFKQLQADFYPFCAYQMELFGEFAVSDYHFMFQILPHQAYHGVEHANSTVCLLGPSYELFKKDGMYLELLGVSSHELFHAWNVKRIRPVEMWPYDYSKENYSRLGYLAEGATTFYGDWILLRAGVFTEAEFYKTFEQLLDRHFNNPGVLNMSVADSSFDLWLDGYVAGIPNRKASIYTEGALITFCLDILIRKNTDSKYSFDDVMREFYTSYYLANKGVSEEDYFNVVKKYLQFDVEGFFDKYVNAYEDITSLLKECLQFLGLEFIKKASTSYSESYLGFRCSYINNKLLVTSIYPDSPAELAGLSVDDELISINSYSINYDLDKWAEYFEGGEIQLLVKRKYAGTSNLKMKAAKELYYASYVLRKSENIGKEQEMNYKKWRS